MKELKDPKNWLFILLIGVIVYLAMAKQVKTLTETIYIPQEVIVERVIQTETIAVPEDMLETLVESALGDNFDEILDHISDLDMSIAALTTVNASGTGSRINENVIEQTPTGVIVTPVNEELTVAFGEDTEVVEVPVAYVNLSEKGELNAGAYDIDLTLTNIVTETENRSLSTISSLTFEIEGTEYDIPITGQTQYRLWEEPVPNSRVRFRLLDPNIDLSLDVSMHNDLRIYPGASVGVSLSSLNRGNDRIWRFIRPAVGFNSQSNINFTFTPILYNLGHEIPVFNDLWIGPHIGTEGNSNWMFGITIGTTL